MKKILIAAALTAIALPAVAQTGGNWLSGVAQTIASKPKLAGRAESALRGSNVDAAKDPWQPMTIARMASSAVPGEGKRSYRLSAPIDWNGDGVPDVAYLATNRTQMAVVVRLGGGKGTTLAYRGVGTWGSGEELVAAGKRRLILNVPESTLVVLTAESGRPMAYFTGD